MRAVQRLVANSVGFATVSSEDKTFHLYEGLMHEVELGLGSGLGSDLGSGSAFGFRFKFRFGFGFRFFYRISVDVDFGEVSILVLLRR